MKPLPFPPIDSWTHDSWLSRNSTIYWTLIQRACSLLGNLAPSPVRYCLQAGTIAQCSMAIPNFCQVSCLEDGEHYGKTSEVYEHRPTLLSVKWVPLQKGTFHSSSEAMQCGTPWPWIGKAFYKSMNGNFGRITAFKGGKFLFRLPIPVKKKKMLLFSWRKQSNINDLP